jgi:RNA polymerase sigma factor (sigma-70 family)
MATGLGHVLESLQQTGGGLSDGQLLARFVATRDEAAFATLVRRHGPMVLGVCRRVLHDYHDAEDAFQATFLVLARKAASVVVGHSLGGWLHGVACHTAMRAVAGISRRRSRERPMNDSPHPEIMPAETQDWLPLLDRELALLPEKYRAALVHCDLEGRSRREAARLLGVTEGTLSSRLSRGRALLAKRLSARGLGLSGGALVLALTADATSAKVPAILVMKTAKVAALVAAGHTAALSMPAVLLMKEVMKAMLLKKLRLAVGAVLVLVALGVVGFGYQASAGSGAAQAAPPDQPRNELEALRRENELLKLNLEVVLEKVRAQGHEIQSLRKEVAASNPRAKGAVPVFLDYDGDGFPDLFIANGNLLSRQDGTFLYRRQAFEDLTQKAGVHAVHRGDVSGPMQEAESALKTLREAKDKEGQRRATQALEKALQKLKQQTKPDVGPASPKGR